MENVLDKLRLKKGLSLLEISVNTGVSMSDVAEVLRRPENSPAEHIKSILIFLSK